MNYIGKKSVAGLTSLRSERYEAYFFLITSNYLIVMKILRKLRDYCGNYKHDAFGVFYIAQIISEPGGVLPYEYNIKTLSWFPIFQKTKRRRSDSVLWQKPLHPRKCQKGKVTTKTTPQKSSIKQRLRTDLGRSVGNTNFHSNRIIDFKDINV